MQCNFPELLAVSKGGEEADTGICMLLSVTAGLLILVMSAGFFTGSDSSTVYAVRSSTGSGKGLDGLRRRAAGFRQV